MKLPYTLEQLLAPLPFENRRQRIAANVETLKLGKIQSRRYFEAVATLIQAKRLPTEFQESKSVTASRTRLEKYKAKNETV